VERPFWFIENNFLAGRTFRSWEDLNRQARQWCDTVNSTYKKQIHAIPRELFAVERTHLKPLPAWIPEVYRLHARTAESGAAFLPHGDYRRSFAARAAGLGGFRRGETGREPGGGVAPLPGAGPAKTRPSTGGPLSASPGANARIPFAPV
jgi:hypothetical protein